MSRKRLTTEEITEKYQNLKDILDYLKEKRTEAPNDDIKNELTRKISAAKKNLNNFKRQYMDRLSPEIKQQERQPKQPLPRLTLNARMRQIEDKAKLLLEQASTEEEKKSIKDRLEACRLRYKYSY